MKAFPENALTGKITKCYLLRVPCKGYVFGNNPEFVSLIIFYKRVNS